MVLDDIIDNLASVIKQKMDQRCGKTLEVKELLRPLENWEINPKCTRSIKYHHHKGKPAQIKVIKRSKTVNTDSEQTEVIEEP